VATAEEILRLYFPVLDHGFVSLVDYMGSDGDIEQAARVAYGYGTRKTSETRGRPMVSASYSRSAKGRTGQGLSCREVKVGVYRLTVEKGFFQRRGIHDVQVMLLPSMNQETCKGVVRRCGVKVVHKCVLLSDGEEGGRGWLPFGGGARGRVAVAGSRAR